MTVDASRWRESAGEIMESVADENFQRTTWFGKGPFISSPEEIYNAVFSDLDIEAFIASPDVALNDLEKATATKLVAKMAYFEKLIGDDLSPDRVIDHPAWREVRIAAQRMLDVLQRPGSSTKS